MTPAILSVDLRHIVGLADALHRRRDLSGVLAYTGSHFFQVIEGLSADVDGLLHLIRADLRHADIRVIGDEVITRRLFDRWYSLHVESPRLIDEVGTAYLQSASHCTQAEELTQRLLCQLRSDDFMH